MTPIKVMLVDDQAMFRDGLRMLLGTESDIVVVGEAGNGREAITAVASCRPDVVLMDLHMPELDGVQTTRLITRDHPHIKVVALTTFDDDELVFEVIKEGAVGYLLKGTSSTAVAAAVRAAATGQSVLAPEVTAKVMSEFARMARLVPRPAAGSELGLSDREIQVLRLLAQGSSNKEIASSLFVAEGTVKNHLTNIFKKLAVSDRTQAAIKAREHGIA